MGLVTASTLSSFGSPTPIDNDMSCSFAIAVSDPEATNPPRQSNVLILLSCGDLRHHTPRSLANSLQAMTLPLGFHFGKSHYGGYRHCLRVA